MAKDQIGMICEQGDLGLFFTPLDESDQKTIKNNEEEEKNKKPKKQ